MTSIDDTPAKQLRWRSSTPSRHRQYRLCKRKPPDNPVLKPLLLGSAQPLLDWLTAAKGEREGLNR